MKYIMYASAAWQLNFAQASDTVSMVSKRYSLHMQETTVSQFRPNFYAPYSGAHSQQPEQEWATTVTSTFFAALRPWKNAILALNPEIAGGHGLSSAFGMSAFTNGEAFRVGNPDPTFYLARAYYRQLIAIGEETQQQSDDDNVVQMAIPKKYVGITIGKISVADYFDNNSYAHNARTQFMSWGLMSNGAWDYPANTRGYTPSLLLEYVTKKIECRYALSMLPVSANGNVMDQQISKANGNTLELVYRYANKGLSGKVRGLAFYNTGFFGSYTAKNTIPMMTPQIPGSNTVFYNIANSRQYGRSKYGFGINAEQSLGKHVGAFAKASFNDGRNETWCFTEIDQAISAGLLSDGEKWQRKNDKLGFGWCSSGLSKAHRQYLANGGLGFMLGDGRMRYRAEQVIEAFYAIALPGNIITTSVFYQMVVNPGCNADRGPIHVYSIRLHVHI